VPEPAHGGGVLPGAGRARGSVSLRCSTAILARVAALLLSARCSVQTQYS
jgi:hypothetical protein